MDGFTVEIVFRLINAFDPGLMPGTGLAREAAARLCWLWNHVLPHHLEPVKDEKQILSAGNARQDQAVFLT